MENADSTPEIQDDEDPKDRQKKKGIGILVRHFKSRFLVWKADYGAATNAFADALAASILRV